MEDLVKKLKKQTTMQLMLKVEKTTGEEREAILDILEARHQDVSEWRPSASETKTVGSSTVFEAEPEEELSEEEAEALKKAEEEFDANAPTATETEAPVKTKKSRAPKAPKTPKVPKAPKEPKEKKVRTPKVSPADESKCTEILALLKEGTLSKYAIAKKLDTYYSVVDYVAKRYLS